MKKIIIFVAFISFNTLAVDPVTMAYLNANPTHVIQSPSGYCWMLGSNVAENTALVGNAPHENIFTSYEDCLRNDGKITETEKQRVVASAGIEGLTLINEVESEQQQSQPFAGINWGPALAFTFLSEEVVNEVSIVDSTVRVDHAIEQRAILMLESHYFFTFADDQYGVGPFIAIGIVGEDGIDPLSTYSTGIMFGAKTGGKDDLTQSWNIGFGYFIDSSANVLREQYSDGQTVTISDPTALLKKDDIDGFALMFSATF